MTKTVQLKNDCLICNTPLKQFLGVMFKKKFVPHIFPYKNLKSRSFHSFFCKPIDMICLNEKNIVLSKEYFSPWKIGVFQAKTIIETMPGTLKVKKGEVIQWYEQNIKEQ